MIQRVAAAGGAFRRRGAHLEVVGGEIDGELRRDLARRWAAIGEWLDEDPASSAVLRELVRELRLEVILVEAAAEAEQIVAGLPEVVGIDLETFDPAATPPPLRITARGALHPHQPRAAGRGGLDPNRARIRTVQVFAPAGGGGGTSTCSTCGRCPGEHSPACGSGSC